MTMSWKLGRFAGIDVFLHPTLLIVALLALASGGGWLTLALVAAVFGCVLLHEYGHALTARAFGIETEDITLYPIGGVARLRRLPRAPGAELLVTLAGPAVNLGIGAGLAALLWVGGGFAPWTAPTLLGVFLENLMWVNLGLALFNLMPVFPMDGGRILRALLSGPLGRARATSVAATIGQVAALGFGVWFLSQGYLIQTLLAGFIFYAAGVERRQVLADEWRRSRPSTADQGIWVAPAGYRWVDRGQGVWQLAPLTIPVNDPYQARRWR